MFLRCTFLVRQAVEKRQKIEILRKLWDHSRCGSFSINTSLEELKFHYALVKQKQKKIQQQQELERILRMGFHLLKEFIDK